MLRLAMLVLVVFVAGCSGPFMGLPGGKLAGPEALFDVSAIPVESELLELETNPSEPYSVIIGFRRIDGQIFIDPTSERRWYQYIAVNPNVRIRFDGSELIHPAVAEVVEDATILAEFEADRIVLRFVTSV